MNLFSESIFGELRKQFDSPQKVAIITHFNPDGDALGSTLALQTALKRYGHQVYSILPSMYPPYYAWMHEIESCIVSHQTNLDKIKEIFSTVDFVFCLDFNTPSRVNHLSELLINSPAKKVLIDHHEDPSTDFDYSFSYSGMSSTCELIYNFIEKFYSLEDIDKTIGDYIYTGLITDTGGFQFSSTHASSHLIAAHLIEVGIEPNTIYNNCFNNFSLARLNLFGYCINNNMIIFHQDQMAIVWLDQATCEKFQVKEGDTEGLVNYPLKVHNIEVSILLKQDYDKIKLSLRSKGNIDVSKIARQFFSGGGHKNASGGMSKQSLKDTIQYIQSISDKFFE